MSELFRVISRYKNFMVFVALEVLCGQWITSNGPWRFSFLNTSNYYVAGILSLSNSLEKYLSLEGANQKLANENARLKKKVESLKGRLADTAPKNYEATPKVARRYSFIPARSIDSQINQSDNYITIDKGLKDGVRQGMGVISTDGVVGKVKFCTEEISVITSILHSNFSISSEIVRNGEIGTVKWDGADPGEAQMLDMSRTEGVKPGDTIVTSQFNAVFPSGVPVGIVQRFAPRAGTSMPDLNLKLATDFRKLTYVYVVKDGMQAELGTLKEKLKK